MSSLLNIGRYHYEAHLFHVNAQPTLTCTANIDPKDGILANELSDAVLCSPPKHLPYNFPAVLPTYILG